MPRARLVVSVAVAAVVLAGGAVLLGRGEPEPARSSKPVVDGPRSHAVAYLPPLPVGRPIVCPLAPESAALLPAGARRGLSRHLRQYPAPALASGEQRRAAAALLARIDAVVRPWRDPAAAARAGFSTRLARRAPADRSVHWLHAEHRLNSADRRFLDPTRPESLIYANAPGRPLVLVGVMFSMRRGMAGPTPGGPITRWHSHLVCVRGQKRGLKPRTDGSCPAGATRRQGSEMMHVWLTKDLRSAFAVQAPGPEFCAARVLRFETCRDPAAIRVM